MSNERNLIICLIVELKKSPKPYEHFGGEISAKDDLSNYATKADLKDPTGIYTFNFAITSNLDSLKIEIDKLNIDKLLPVPAILHKLSDAVKNDVVKKTVYDKLVVQVNDIDISGFVLKSEYETDKSDLEKNISDVDKNTLILVNLLKKQI